VARLESDMKDIQKIILKVEAEMHVVLSDVTNDIDKTSLCLCGVSMRPRESLRL